MGKWFFIVSCRLVSCRLVLCRTRKKSFLLCKRTFFHIGAASGSVRLALGGSRGQPGLRVDNFGHRGIVVAHAGRTERTAALFRSRRRLRRGASFGEGSRPSARRLVRDRILPSMIVPILHIYKIFLQICEKFLTHMCKINPTKILQSDVPARWLGGNYHHKRFPVYGRSISLVSQTRPCWVS
jgi:hypothetical protein